MCKTGNICGFWHLYQGRRDISKEWKTCTLVVDQKLWQEEELWDELLDIGGGLVGGEPPGGVHGVERAVRQVKVIVCKITR